jgi:hypothetical protein
MKFWLSKILLVMGVAFFISGCGLSYTIKDPVVSNIKYDKGDQKAVVVQVVDQRSSTVFHDKLAGLSRANIELGNIEDPIAWLTQALEKEFTARNIPVQVTSKKAQNPADIILTVKKFQVVSRRVSGFSPWESYHSFRGEVTAGQKTKDIRAYFFNGKVPVWSMNEIEEPCFNMPLSLIVKEIASKINNVAIGYSAGEEAIKKSIDQATEKATKKDDYACFPIFELGGSNNPVALNALYTLGDNDDRFIRACALSAIGTLGVPDQFGYLQKKYKQHDEIDKYMALKSIGDAGTPQAMDFVKESIRDPLYNKEMAFKYCADLYLEK